MFVKQWRRQRHQEQLPQGAFNLRGGILVPVLSLLVCVYILVNLKLKVILFGIIALICGIALYFMDKLITKKAKIKEQGLGK